MNTEIYNQHHKIAQNHINHLVRGNTYLRSLSIHSMLKCGTRIHLCWTFGKLSKDPNLYG